MLLFPRSAPSLPATAPVSWPRAWRQPAFRRGLLGAVLVLLALASQLPTFFAYIQARPGTPLPDPLLAALPAHDVSGLTFAVIYCGIAAGLGYLLPRPLALRHTLWAYALLHLLRCGTLWLLPLAPPPGLLVLHDPLVEHFFYAAPVAITKDLFFSGHTATLALLTLALRRAGLRWVLLLATAAVALLVLVQHAHYSYDVVAAPFFAWLAYWLAGRLVAKSEEQKVWS